MKEYQRVERRKKERITIKKSEKKGKKCPGVEPLYTQQRHDNFQAIGWSIIHTSRRRCQAELLVPFCAPSKKRIRPQSDGRIKDNVNIGTATEAPGVFIPLGKNIYIKWRVLYKSESNRILKKKEMRPSLRKTAPSKYGTATRNSIRTICITHFTLQPSSCICIANVERCRNKRGRRGFIYWNHLPNLLTLGRRRWWSTILFCKDGRPVHIDTARGPNSRVLYTRRTIIPVTMQH